MAMASEYWKQYYLKKLYFRLLGVCSLMYIIDDLASKNKEYIFKAIFTKESHDSDLNL